MWVDALGRRRDRRKEGLAKEGGGEKGGGICTHAKSEAKGVEGEG